MASTTPAKSLGQYLHAPRDLRLESKDLAPLGPDEVQISIRATTLCGSDLHYYAHGRNGSILVREPLCLGHEASGTVLAVGRDVQSLHLDDKVAIECGLPCETCELCREGRYNLCSNMRFRSSGSAFPHLQGTLQETINHPAKWVHR
jgi:L-iditol 2-dehydrogenase